MGINVVVRVVLRYLPTAEVQHKGNHVLELCLENLSYLKERNSRASIQCIVVRKIDSSLMSWDCLQYCVMC